MMAGNWREGLHVRIVSCDALRVNRQGDILYFSTDRLIRSFVCCLSSFIPPYRVVTNGPLTIISRQIFNATCKLKTSQYLLR
jgi:hypothetical protein